MSLVKQIGINYSYAHTIACAYYIIGLYPILYNDRVHVYVCLFLRPPKGSQIASLSQLSTTNFPRL